MPTPWFVIMRITVFQPSGVYPEPVRAVSGWQLLHFASTNGFPLSSTEFWPQAGHAEHSRTATASMHNRDVVVIEPSSRDAMISDRTLARPIALAPRQGRVVRPG